MAHLSREDHQASAVMYYLHHVFLPPKLPHEDDFNVLLEKSLTRIVHERLQAFREALTHDSTGNMEPVLKMLSYVLDVHEVDGAGINEAKLGRALKALSTEGGIIALHIQAQNAGMLISVVDDSIRFEAFELSPLNEAVNTTRGRLRRSFPGVARYIKIKDFERSELRDSIAHTLAKMSVQAGPKPVISKARRKLKEDRDTTHPKLVTELFMAYVGAMADRPDDVPRLGKNTREEVMFRATLQPWRRSPGWLFLRVALQLSFSRSTLKLHSGCNPYKAFMVFLMSGIIDRTFHYKLPAEYRHAMSAKIVRRLSKLGHLEGRVLNQIETTVKRNHELVQTEWLKAIREDGLTTDDSCTLEKLQFHCDIYHLLPQLDEYIQATATWENEGKNVLVPSPPSLPIFDSDRFPDYRFSHGDFLIYELRAFEAWVSSCLNQCLDAQLEETETCRKLSNLIHEYYDAAHTTFSGDPESTSNMILTVLELWVACDKAALSACEILKDYNPCIPIELFQSFVMPFKSQMNRLFHIEEYLAHRSRSASSNVPFIFSGIGTPSSFSVRYFKQSPDHQALSSKILQEAGVMRSSKRNEYRQKKDKYNDLIQRRDRSDCEYYEVFTDEFDGIMGRRHSGKCQRCSLQTQAAKLSIEIHEWPLPDDDLMSKSIVFELRVPRWFGYWRDVTLFLVLNVLGSTMGDGSQPDWNGTLSRDPAIASRFIPYSQDLRIGLLSQVKSHMDTHRRVAKLSATRSEDDVVLNNARHYRYHDTQTNLFTATTCTTDEVRQACTYTLPARSMPLQQFLKRPAGQPSGPPPNTVIASQSECPDHLSLEEYKAMASIPLGYRIQWTNILVQLSAPSIDFSKLEAALIILQCIFQAGPSGGCSMREGHNEIGDPTFAFKLVRALEEAISGIEGNWESFRALNLFTSLATRILSLSSLEAVRRACFSILASARTIGHRWLRSVKDEAHSLTDSTKRGNMLSKATIIALVCLDTFDVDEECLESILSEDHPASVMIECSIIVQEGIDALLDDADFLVLLLHRRWQCLSYKASFILSRAITEGLSTSLDIAIKASWSTYESGTKWTTASKSPAYFLTSTTNPREDGTVLTVHFNLLTGSLFVNGLPLSRLPQEYESHPSYIRLFGHSCIDVMPSAVPGMQLSSKRMYAGYNLHFGLSRTQHNSAHDLRIQTEKDGHKWILVPPRLLRGDFPAALVDDFVHWFDINDGGIHFCRASSPLENSTNEWILTKQSGHAWVLAKDNTHLISIKSLTAEVLSRKLGPLEVLPHIQMIYKPSESTVHVEIPRIKLGFQIASGSTSILSKQYRGMAIDENQHIGSLIGLRDKLVLKGASSRRLLLLEGLISYERKGDHVHVTVDKDTVKRVRLYEVDDILKGLRGDESLQSELLLCYYHALTSFCLPDPFLGITGTEQALLILQSANVLSQDHLLPENLDILMRIAQITPERRYYPKNERVMQTVDWSDQLAFFAQHEGVFQAVSRVLEQADRAKIFYPDMPSTWPDLGARGSFLSHRDRIRSSTWKTTGFGAEDFSTEFDVEYNARDRGQDTIESHNAFAAAAAIWQEQNTIHFQGQKAIKSYFSPLARAWGPEHQICHNDIRYDSKQLDTQVWLFENWCAFHRYLRRSDRCLHKFQFMIWLSTLAFGGTVDMSVVYVLALLFTSPRVPISPPERAEFHPSRGATIEEALLHESARNAMLPFSRTYVATSSLCISQQRTYQSNRERAIELAVAHLTGQWPCEVPTAPPDGGVKFSDYIGMGAFMQDVRSHFKIWYENLSLFGYLEELQALLKCGLAAPVVMTLVAVPEPSWNTGQKGFVSMHDVLGHPAPDLPEKIHHRLDHPAPSSCTKETPKGVTLLLDRLCTDATTEYEKSYVDRLQKSHASLHTTKTEYRFNENDLEAYERYCRRHMLDTFEMISTALNPCQLDFELHNPPLAYHIRQWPRLSPRFLLRQLSRHYWPSMTKSWKLCFLHYGLAVTRLQRAVRLLRSAGNHEDLARELKNCGHTNWDPLKYPESLLLEVESGLLIRDIQEVIAAQMRDPPNSRNSIMQLNMGEGKSSVIVPIVTAALANTSLLVRVIVARPQARQMFQMLLSKLGGLLDRRVYRMPFSRALKPGRVEAESIWTMCRECMEVGGVLLVQPEHVLSLKLMGLQCLISGAEEVAEPLLKIQSLFDQSSRDIVDESDEIFSAKFELVYAMGLQRSIDHCPERWKIIQQVLGLVGILSPSLAESHPAGMEILPQYPGGFPRTRILHVSAQQLLLRRIAHRICEEGLVGFAAATQAPDTRRALFNYIVEPELSTQQIELVECSDSVSFWSKSTKDTLYLLRGLFAGGVLGFCLGEKRWRVNYGLYLTREPPTRLAVPYRAKDSPSARSEFSHPDVVIILTSLCYYYSGLTDTDLLLAFAHLRRSDQADTEYQAWVKDAPTLPTASRQLSGVNLEDQSYFSSQIFPSMRYSKSIIDYFLANLVFTKEMKEFPQKLSASGWDLGQVKAHPTTGFSGTNDSRHLLPFGIEQLDLPEQSHTNALVLSYLLQPENCAVAMPSHIGTEPTSSLFLSDVASMSPAPRVILDVGAQIIDLSNIEVAEEWLRRCADHDQTQAVVFFNDHDELSVVDRAGYVEALQISSFSEQLDRCLVFLDEAHTRGTDLKLPSNYRAAVTLGPNVTKDRLVQACMRMRKLGKGQSVAFYVPEEIRNKTHCSPGTAMSVSDVLCWAMRETWNDTKQSIPLWAAQGDRSEMQQALWADSSSGCEIRMSQDQAMKFLENDSRTLDQMYNPRSDLHTRTHHSAAIEERCRAFRGPTWDQAKLQEEQERELAPEMEQEREVQRPPPARPAVHCIHPDLRTFISSGQLIMSNGAFSAAFDSLKSTSAAAYLEVEQFPTDVLVTADFARTIRRLRSRPSDISDSYHRSPQWVLTSHDPQTASIRDVIIISPFEAQELLPEIRVSKIATLHAYAPRPNQSFPALDKLDLFTIPARKLQLRPPVRALLNLFSGQLYLGSDAEYRVLCEVLGLASESARQDQVVSAEGFILESRGRPPCTFRDSPVKFLIVLLTKIRRNCEGIDKTHMGILLGGQLLGAADFDE